MKAEKKREWVSALRSGDYQQGTGCLRGADGRYCCLGVLCHLQKDGKFKRNPDEVVRTHDDLEAIVYEYEGELATIVPPVALMNHVDLDDSIIETLTEMNDVEEKTFPEIADWIEGNIQCDTV